MDDFPLLARPEQTLEHHINEVAAHATRCGAKVGMGSAAKISALIHDLGKVSQDFQEYIRRVIPGCPSHGKKIDHSTLGGQYLNDMPGFHSFNAKIMRQIIILCGVSHHNGCLINCLSPAGDPSFKERLDKSRADTHFEELTSSTLKKIQDEIHTLAASQKMNDELERFATVANKPSATIRLFYWGFLARFLFSCLVEADQVSAAGEFSEKQTIPDWDKLLASLNDHLTQFDTQPADPVNLLRKELADICLHSASRRQGQYLLNLPTGGGKTLASLRFALAHAKQHKLDRIIYVVPYTSIIEQNANAARKALGDENSNIVLEHHSNLTRDKDTEEYRKRIQSWNTPIIFTTSVQFLNTLFASGSTNVRRMNALARSVIIFDEIQTIPLHSVHIFNNALNFLAEIGQTTTVCCTATQPALDMVDKENGRGEKQEKGSLKLSEHDKHIVPNYQHYFDEFSRLRPLDIIIRQQERGWTLEEMSSLARDEAGAHGSVLFIVNTRKLARLLFFACRSDDYEVRHLSTFMCPAHRSEIITKELKKDALREKIEGGKKVICITTQLIEAGVDVDFNVVIRCTAGLDSITQAAGRCNRDGKYQEGRLIIINPIPELEKLDSLETIKKGKELTERIIREYNDTTDKNDNKSILAEQWLNQYFRYFYQLFDEKTSYTVTVDHLTTTLLDLLSKNSKPCMSTKNTWPEWDNWKRNFPLPQSFESAAKSYRVIDADTIDVLTPFGEGKNLITQLSKLGRPKSAEEWKQVRQLLNQAQRYSISLFTNKLAEIQRNGMFNRYFYSIGDSFTMYCLSETCYDPIMGFIESDGNTEATIF